MLDKLKYILSGFSFYNYLLSYVHAKHCLNEMRIWNESAKPDFPLPHSIKQNILKALSIKYQSKVLIETGTYRGDMVRNMVPYFEKIYSIELSKHFFILAKNRFKKIGNVTIMNADSPKGLLDLCGHLQDNILFWLDGHYSGGKTGKSKFDTPILEELAILFSFKNFNPVIAIDDARLFNGTNDYPTLEQLFHFVKNKSPESTLKKVYDVILIEPPKSLGLSSIQSINY